MGSTTLGSITLEGNGKSFIAENSCRKEAVLTPLPLYLMDSDQTDIFDFGGVMKTISLNGIYIGANVAECKAFIDSCEAIIQGHQDTQAGYPITFTDDYRGAIKVKIMDFESIREAASGRIIRWNLKILQASTNA